MKGFLCPQGKYTPNSLNESSVPKHWIVDIFYQHYFRKLDRLGYKSPAWAGKFLDTWCDKANRSRMLPMKSISSMLQRHKDLLLNWFKAKKQYNSGIVEGLNYKVNILVRKAFGFKSFEVIKVALYHQLGDLPKPNFEHQFW